MSTMDNYFVRLKEMEEFTMSKILITGATGTIGKELTKHLIKRHQLILVDVDFSEFPEELKQEAQIIETDLVDRENWRGLLEDIEYVIQLAGEPDQNAEFYGDLEELNFEIPHNLFDEALEAEHLKRILFASSVHAVNGYPDDIQVKTTDPVRPSGLYGVSKVYIEALAAHHAYVNDIPSIGIRIANYTIDNEELDSEVDEAGMAMYFSARDMNHLVDCCLEAELNEPYLLVNGLSNNTFKRLSIEEAQNKLDYQPKDNAFEIAGYFKN